MELWSRNKKGIKPPCDPHCFLFLPVHNGNCQGRGSSDLKCASLVCSMPAKAATVRLFQMGKGLRNSYQGSWKWVPKQSLLSGTCQLLELSFLIVIIQVKMSYCLWLYEVDLSIPKSFITTRIYNHTSYIFACVVCLCSKEIWLKRKKWKKKTRSESRDQTWNVFPSLIYFANYLWAFYFNFSFFFLLISPILFFS